MKHPVAAWQLEDLTELWHVGCWPDCELEDVIREATDWTHDEFGTWAAQGKMPIESVVPRQRGAA